MPALNYYELQKAIYEKLSGNSQLMAIISGIFNYPPQDINYPFLTIGNVVVNDFPALGRGGTQQQLELHIWSREAGHKQAADIMNIVYGLLHNGSLEVTGQTVLMMRFTATSIKLEDDGYTHHGIMGLKVVLAES
jgi:hypothetical protein